MLAFAAWAASLLLPRIAPGAANAVVMAEICSVGGTRSAPVDRHGAGHASECPCCVGGAAAGPPPVAPAARLRIVGAGTSLPPAVEVRGTSLALPPNRGPPGSSVPA
jgi:hypothetical protein